MRGPIVRVLLLASAVLAALVDPGHQPVDRWFSLSIYPRVQRVLTPLTNTLPVACFDVVLVAVLAWVSWRLVRTVGALRHRQFAQAAQLCVGVAVLASALYLTFLALWGLNYRRTPLAMVVDSEPPPTAQAVEALGLRSVSEMNRGYDEAHRWLGERLDPRVGPLPAALRSVTTALGAPVGTPVAARLKSTVLGPYFRWAGVDGMTNPFGLEVLVNPDLLPVERPFVAAHEWAHLAGFAVESEASFVGWLACLKADAGSRYSAWLFLYWQLAGDLDAETRAGLASRLDKGPRADVAAIAERLRRGRIPALQEGSWRVYDQYLKANRVVGGVRSYGEVVTLILRTRTTSEGVPLRRPR